MNQNELVSAIAEKTGLTKKVSGEAMKTMLDVIIESVSKGGDVKLTGFGSFKRTQRKAREGRNPATGEKMTIAARKTVSFSAGKVFKDRVK